MKQQISSEFSVNGAAQESNLPSLGLPDLTGFEDRLGHRARPLRAEAYAARGGIRSVSPCTASSSRAFATT
jgi:hypothetical protein